MPLKGILIDIPEGMTGSLSIVETEVQSYSGYQIFPVPEAVVDANGATAAVGESFVFDEAAYARDAFYPQDVAQLAAIYTFREQDKQQVVFYPLSFNAVSGDLRFYTRIRVRIDYVQNHLAKADTIAPMAWQIPTPGASLSEQLSSMGTMRGQSVRATILDGHHGHGLWGLTVDRKPALSSPVFIGCGLKCGVGTANRLRGHSL
jgi:hypothetical protein